MVSESLQKVAMYSSAVGRSSWVKAKSADLVAMMSRHSSLSASTKLDRFWNKFVM